MRILGNIRIYGNFDSLRRIEDKNIIPDGLLQQVGSSRKIQDKDSWRYGTPNYQFHNIAILDEEIRDFLTAHIQLELLQLNMDTGITLSIFTLMPVDQNFDDPFACALTRKTLAIMVRMGLDFQISPEVIMPIAPYWKARDI